VEPPQTRPEEDVLDLQRLLALLRRWWWLLTLATAAGAAGAFLFSRTITPIYEASARVLIQGGRSPVDVAVGGVQPPEPLARVYADLVLTRPVLERVLEGLGTPLTEEGVAALRGQVRARARHSILTVSVRDPSPGRAADLANRVADAFIQTVRERQLAALAQFQASLAQYGIPNDPSIVAAQAAIMANLTLVEVAVPPTGPVSPRTPLNTILGGVLGLLLGGAGVLLLQALDVRVRSLEELRSLAGAVPLGVVYRLPSRDDRPPLLTEGDRKGPPEEAYRFVLTALEFATVDQGGSKTLLITSPVPGEGKSTTAVNLAVAAARGGKRALVVEGDLRRPVFRRLFGLPADAKGLTDFLLGNAPVEAVMHPIGVEGVRVVPSGPLPPDPAPLLRSERVRRALEAFRGQADLVLLDSPPVMTVADPLYLVPLVDGVILVVDAEATGREAVRRAGDLLRQAHPRFLGALLNKVSVGGRGYYGYYPYYYYYPGGPDGRRRRGLLARLGGVGRARRRRGSP
jgi:non-specific protein-tyrosine kinase